ncbi:FtsK/SpoIIIE domain-containing protein [Streptomyces spiramenti]|uniref:FtsK/SpoIIIE domain-containing protein n=1 Tax=Streptomyces spiramenti TaxID=2720606 RepID=UPI0030843A09
MLGLVLVLVLVAALVALRWVRPAWWWLTVGWVLAVVRVLRRWSSVMDACGLVEDPSRMRLAVARWVHRPLPSPRVPRLVRLRVTSTGLVVRVRLLPGQDAYDFRSAADRLRHSFAMQQVTCREVRAGLVELRMTGFDVLARVRMSEVAGTSGDGLRLPVAVVEDGSTHWRDYRRIPHALTIGATQSGKSVYQRRLVKLLAPLPVALVGIDCKEGVELAPYAPRLSALVSTPEDALGLLNGLLERMEAVYQLIRREQRISADTAAAEITSDIWGLPAGLRPTPVVVIVDEVAELALVASKAEEKRRDAIITALVRLAQLGRAAGIYLEVCGQRFGADLGSGITMLRAQLSARTVHRVNDEGTAKMALSDAAPDAVAAAVRISPDRPGVAVAATAAGGWSLIRTPHTTMREAVSACAEHAAATPRINEIAAWQPSPSVSLNKAPMRPAATPA